MRRPALASSSGVVPDGAALVHEPAVKKVRQIGGRWGAPVGVIINAASFVPRTGSPAGPPPLTPAAVPVAASLGFRRRSGGWRAKAAGNGAVPFGDSRLRAAPDRGHALRDSGGV